MFATHLGNIGQFSSSMDNGEDHRLKLENTISIKDNGSGDNQVQIDKTKLIINYIPQFASESDLAVLFTPIGRVESIKIMRDFKTGYSYGFGFVKYFTPDDAAKAIEMLNGFNYRNKKLKVSYSRPPTSDMKNSNLYITNLPKHMAEGDVENVFKKYGEIVQMSVLKDKITGLPRGVAFVRYSKGDEAQCAIANLDGHLIENSVLPLSVRVAEDHGRQRAQLLENWSPVNVNRVFSPIRGITHFRETNTSREFFQARFGRFPLHMRNMGAGDNFFQNSCLY